MIQILAGEKGEGKTKRLLDMANEAVKVADGHVVFIDDDKRHMYDLNSSIRFVQTAGFVMESQSVFYGFILGILSQDSDIQKIYIDGLGNIVKAFTDAELVAFVEALDKTSKECSVDFTMILSRKKDTLPEKVQACVI